MVVAKEEDPHTIAAVSDAIEKEIVEATMVGNPEEIKRVAKEHNVDPDKFEIIETAHALGIDMPKVALIAAVEKVSLKMAATTEAAIITKIV